MVFKVSDPTAEVDSSLAAEIDQFIGSIMRLPEIDSSRVEAIRQAIAEDTYQPNAMRIADKLILFEVMLMT